MLAGYAVDVAAERVVNVLIGGVIGYGFVLGVHAMGEMRVARLKRAGPRAVR